MPTKPDFPLKYVPLPRVRDEIGDAWGLFFRGEGFVSNLIKFGSDSPYSHTGMAVWARNELMCSEVREFKGGRNVTLASQVKRFPGQIDVYQPDPAGRFSDVLDYESIANYMHSLAGVDYGWFNVWRATLLHLPFVRLGIRYFAGKSSFGKEYLRRCLLSQYRDAEKKERPPYCSMAFDIAYRKGSRGGKFDLFPNRDSALTEPGHLAQHLLFEYRYTLVPE